ncbi:hypothetical protein KL905_003302 [Ogataea polymorpha]|nr:hypothetical protein KL905_003302 [Ogataea polymorpha]KAG7935690.1 hypothetical protein KL934_002249 [Ogataea polymorpha]
MRFVTSCVVQWLAAGAHQGSASVWALLRQPSAPEKAGIANVPSPPSAAMVAKIFRDRRCMLSRTRT